MAVATIAVAPKWLKSRFAPATMSIGVFSMFLLLTLPASLDMLDEERHWILKVLVSLRHFLRCLASCSRGRVSRNRSSSLPSLDQTTSTYDQCKSRLLECYHTLHEAHTPCVLSHMRTRLLMSPATMENRAHYERVELTTLRPNISAEWRKHASAATMTSSPKLGKLTRRLRQQQTRKQIIDNAAAALMQSTR